MYLIPRAKAAFRSFATPYWIAANGAIMWLAIDTVPNSWWSENHNPAGPWDDIFVYSLVVVGIANLVAGIPVLMHDTDDYTGGQTKYKRFIKRYAGKPKISILADPDDNSQSVSIYQITKGLNVNEKQFVKSFDAETEAQECWEFITEKREELKPANNTEAKQLAKAINEDK